MRLAPTGTSSDRRASTWACSTRVWGCVEADVAREDRVREGEVRREVERVAAALRRAVVAVLRALVAPARAVVLVVRAAAAPVLFAWLAGFAEPELLVVAILISLRFGLVEHGSWSACDIEHMFVNRRKVVVTFL
jgi:hypothetical protein